MKKPRKPLISPANVLLLGIISISGGSVTFPPSVVAQELTANSRFYFEADGIREQKILEISGLNNGTLSTDSGTRPNNLRQAAPSRRRFSPVILKVVETNRDLANWAAQNTQRNPANWLTQNTRRNCSVSVYNAAGNLQARWDIINCFIYHYSGPILRQGNVIPATIEIHHEGINRVQ